MKNETKATAELTVKRGAEIMKIPFNLLYVEEGFNIRTDMGDIEGLKNNIIELGQQEPIKVKKITSGEHKGKYQVIEGHRRTAAIGQAISEGHDIEFVLALASKGNSEDTIFEMLSAGIYKKELNQVEISEGVKRLSNYGYNNSEIGRKIGKSHTYIAQMLTLSLVSKAVKNLIIENKVKAQDVIKLMKAHNEDESKVEEIILSALKSSAQEFQSDSTDENINEQAESAQETKSESKRVEIKPLKAEVLGIKPLTAIQKLDKAVDLIFERFESKKLSVKDDKKLETLDSLVEQLKNKESKVEETINILLELL